jgi:DnaJ-class molecular chaperone
MRLFHKAAIEWTDGEAEKPRTRTPSRAELYATLYLLPNAPQIVIKASYKALAQKFHPDAGGTHEVMLRINEAYRQLAA